MSPFVGMTPGQVREEETRRDLEKLKSGALRRVAGLFAEPGDEDYNPDGELKKSEVPYRTILAGEYVGHMVRAASDAAAIGVVIRSLQIPDKEPDVPFENVIVVERKKGD